MSTEEIRAYVLEELRSLDDEMARLIEMADQLTGRRHKAHAHDLQPILQGIEGIIDYLQTLHDRCLEMFPDAEADGRADPSLAFLREQIRKWHIGWEGWNMPIP